MSAIKKNKKSVSDIKSESNDILISGARVHNLKNVTVTIPRNKFTVVTGVSGSGKSSLTIDTLFAEGQRRYAESLSSYARQFMQRMDKPDVDYIYGLCPAIAIEQKVITRTPRSTVGSMTEIYDYLRILFARIGKTISPISGDCVKKDDVQDVIEKINQQHNGTKILFIVPMRKYSINNLKEELGVLLQKGFSRLYVQKEIIRIEDLLENEKLLSDLFSEKDQKEIFILIDRLICKEFEEEDIHRMSDSIQTAFFEGDGKMIMEIDSKISITFSNKFEKDGLVFEEPAPNLFSFNNPFGACPTCEGYAQVLGIDPDLVIPNKALSLFEDAVAPWKGEKLSSWKEAFIRSAKHFNFPIHKAIQDLTDEQKNALWYGNEYVNGINDFFKEVEQNLYKVQYRVMLSRYRGRTRCTDCGGFRLRKEALYVKINEKHIGELNILPAKDLMSWIKSLKLSEHDKKIATRILIEIENRLQTLLDVGLGYLSLDRMANSLSGGESQRIQLTRSLGSNLTNSLYILDEPSIGLHIRDTERLISVLKQLRDLGNTVVVVEHDEMMMKEADNIIDMGPLASHLGGEVIAEGDYKAICKNTKSLTGNYLSGKLTIAAPITVRNWSKSILIEGACEHNLKNIDVEFPLNVMCAISGVSGSGKTTLVKKILYPALKKQLGDPVDRPGSFRKLGGAIKEIQEIEMIDQNPIGKSSRSNPVTYIKAYDEIRDLFSKQPLSMIRGFLPKHFSFNVDGGRCDTCKGEGEQVIEMQFLADVHLPCESCRGRKFKDEVLEVRFKEKNIHDVLEMSVDEAISFFKSDEKIGAAIARAIQPLSDVGLGYVKLGQSSNTLSGGEAQRVKLASFLGRGKSQGKTLFIFDEPTTGLHFHDITKLLVSFRALIEMGHSIIVIEHNTDVLRSCDWIIDLGPEAGENGGNLVFAGTPDQLKKSKLGNTGRYL
jgi:excinuclease ABC subunit A